MLEKQINANSIYVVSYFQIYYPDYWLRFITRIKTLIFQQHLHLDYISLSRNDIAVIVIPMRYR